MDRPIDLVPLVCIQCSTAIPAGVEKLAERMPPKEKELRIVEIPGVDIQADGGPHVKNTKEIGEILLLKIENKGKNKRRIYFEVK